MRRTSKTRKLLLLVAALVAMSTGCAGGDGNGDTRVVVDRVHFDHADVASLVADSTAVAEVVITRRLFNGRLRGVPSSIFEARVLDRINGNPPRMVRISQLTEAPGVDLHGTALQEPFETGYRYIVFLVEQFPGGSAAGDERLVGLLGPTDGVAAFRQVGDGPTFELLPGLPERAGNIPRVITEDEVRASLA